MISILGHFPSRVYHYPCRQQVWIWAARSCSYSFLAPFARECCCQICRRIFKPHYHSSWSPSESHTLLFSSSIASTVPLSGLPMGATLADLGFEALSLFQRVQTVHSDKTYQEWPAASFTAEAERFELWAVNLGLFVAGHGSLDYRVREADRLAQTIRRFLQELMDSLVEGETILLRIRTLQR